MDLQEPSTQLTIVIFFLNAALSLGLFVWNRSFTKHQFRISTYQRVDVHVTLDEHGQLEIVLNNGSPDRSITDVKIKVEFAKMTRFWRIRHFIYRGKQWEIWKLFPRDKVIPGERPTFIADSEDNIERFVRVKFSNFVKEVPRKYPDTQTYFKLILPLSIVLRTTVEFQRGILGARKGKITDYGFYEAIASTDEYELNTTLGESPLRWKRIK